MSGQKAKAIVPDETAGTPPSVSGVQRRKLRLEDDELITAEAINEVLAGHREEMTEMFKSQLSSHAASVELMFHAQNEALQGGLKDGLKSVSDALTKQVDTGFRLAADARRKVRETEAVERAQFEEQRQERDEKIAKDLQAVRERLEKTDEKAGQAVTRAGSAADLAEEAKKGAAEAAEKVSSLRSLVKTATDKRTVGGMGFIIMLLALYFLLQQFKVHEDQDARVHGNGVPAQSSAHLHEPPHRRERGGPVR